MPASQTALMAKRPAAGATKIARYVVMLPKNVAKPVQVPNTQVVVHSEDVTPMTMSASAPIRNVGILSRVIVPNAKNDRIPTKNPKTATIAPRGAAMSVRLALFASNEYPMPKTSPTNIATTIPIKNNQLPNVFNILSIPSPLFLWD